MKIYFIKTESFSGSQWESPNSESITACRGGDYTWTPKTDEI